MVKVTPAQIRKIHALARERGMDDELLHIYVQNLVKKESISKLTISEAARVIDGMEPRPGGAGQARATRKQLWHINKQLSEIGWVDDRGEPDTTRLNGFLRERFGVEHYNWLTRRKASEVIEAFKAMIERRQNKDESNIKESV